MLAPSDERRRMMACNRSASATDSAEVGHNEDACILRQRLRYLDELLLADTQTAHKCVGRGLEVECVEDARGGACLGLPVNEKRYPAHLLVPEENVLGNCHGRDKIEFLVDHAEPGEQPQHP